MRILVTGGCGFIGTNVVAALIGRGHQVSILDNLAVGRRAYLQTVPGGRDVEVTEGDVRDQEAVRAAAKGVEAVLHLAAQTSVAASIRSPEDDASINVLGTLQVLTASLREGVRKLVFASSNAAVGGDVLPVREDLIPRPISPYGAGKLAGEAYCLAFWRSAGLDVTILRFSNAYGPFSLHKSSVVARFIQDALTSRVLTIYGDGRQTRDFVFVGDLCQAIVEALERPAACGEVFQIGSGTETSILELAERLQALVPGPVTLRFEPARKGEIIRNRSEIAKAASLLGFHPVVPLEVGLSTTLQWFQGVLSPPACGASLGPAG
ncbi:MAG: NAD-dependent epimerase/dehydratase family protein [Deltaproteobacteria bacterium]|nr:NAD-dependent epimerase/dehydratase family protein [Deltaproteobacteria bacterium]